MTTGTTPQDFMKRLDATAADTEALLTRLLSDQPLSGEIVRPHR
nr:geranylgeranyl pyrophosphate synthase [Afipia sp.]